METDETKSIQQHQSPTLKQTDSKTPPTVHVAGISPLPQRSSSGGSISPPGLWAGLRLPMKRVGTIVFILFILALGVSGLFNLAKGAVDSLTAKKPTPTSQPNRISLLQPTSQQPLTQQQRIAIKIIAQIYLLV